MKVKKYVLLPALLLIVVGAFGLYSTFLKYKPNKSFIEKNNVKGVQTVSKTDALSDILVYPNATLISKDQKEGLKTFIFESQDTPLNISKYFLGEAQKRNYKIEGPLNYIRENKRLKITLTANDKNSSVLIQIELLNI